MSEDEMKNRYDALARQIEREDGLVNSRITWMLTFEGFLLAALALAANPQSDPLVKETLKAVLPLFGFTISLLALIAINGALSALEELGGLWSDEKYLGYPRPFGKKGPHARGAMYSRGISITIMVLWLAILSVFIMDWLRNYCS